MEIYLPFMNSIVCPKYAIAKESTEIFSMKSPWKDGNKFGFDVPTVIRKCNKRTNEIANFHP
jgi:hypothetical protein